MKIAATRNISGALFRQKKQILDFGACLKKDECRSLDFGSLFDATSQS